MRSLADGVLDVFMMVVGHIKVLGTGGGWRVIMRFDPLGSTLEVTICAVWFTAICPEEQGFSSGAKAAGKVMITPLWVAPTSALCGEPETPIGVPTAFFTGTGKVTTAPLGFCPIRDTFDTLDTIKGPFIAPFPDTHGFGSGLRTSARWEGLESDGLGTVIVFGKRVGNWFRNTSSSSADGGGFKGLVDLAVLSFFFLQEPGEDSSVWARSSGRLGG